ncbi:MAG: DUF2249 domain-containing protein [Pararhizobium sp.]
MTQFAELDVRPILRDGGEPFQAIMSAVRGLAPGEGLKLFATFRPQPLFAVMAGQGFDHEVVEIDGGDFEVRFTPKKEAVVVSDGAISPEVWADPTVELDLSDLPPPEPMVRILGEIEQMSEGQVLFALLAREPLFLYPELTKRGHQWAGNFDEEGTTFRMMIRAGAAR